MTVPATTAPRGAIIHNAVGYDLLLWALTFGRERRFREQLLAPARLRKGESVLDVGCGTGSLALAAKRQVGAGEVAGIDASAEMIARASRKAVRRKVRIDFRQASADALPFADNTFDVVTSTVMLHHLPKAVRGAAVREMCRVVQPGGRVLLEDFAGARDGTGPRFHFHRQGHVDPASLASLAGDAGLRVAESGPVGRWSLGFVVGIKPWQPNTTDS